MELKEQMERDYYFDNYKVLLIMLVVIAHFLRPVETEVLAAEYIRKAIYLFHMPAFAFVSGYFSRKNPLKKLIKHLLIPYFMMQVIFYILSNTIWGTEKDFGVSEPSYTLWFLLALFAWRCVVNKAVHLKGAIPVAFLAGILIGFDAAVGKYLSLSRIVTFFPFFLLGYCFNKEEFMKIADKRAVKAAVWAVLIAFFGIFLFHFQNVEFEVLESSYSYDYMELSHGWMHRCMFYLVAVTLTYLIAVIIPRGNHWFSYIGSRTMGIYLTHGIVCRTVEYCTDWYDYFNTPSGMIALIELCIILCLVLSSSPVYRIVNKLSAFPIERLVKKQPV